MGEQVEAPWPLESSSSGTKSHSASRRAYRLLASASPSSLCYSPTATTRPTMINADKPLRWKEDIAASVDLYNQWFMLATPKAFRDSRA